MPRSRHGFSLVELVIALVIGSILTSIALSSYGNARGRFAVRGARNTFASLHARARAQAIELGTTVRLTVDLAGDSVALWAGTDRLEVVDFGGELNVDVASSSGNLRLCMSPRGYADTSCNSFSSPVTLTFQAGADTASVQILPLGQLVY